jgi:putative radical SAM enzyme (TIGR03279 family)
MSLPVVVAVATGSPAERAGLRPGDEIVSLGGQVPRDVIQFRLLADEADVDVDVRRGGLELTLAVPKAEGEALGAEVSSALFDQIRTCDNHCEFCFIYQLPKGMRPSLYLKDDDYRLSFLYGNFTTLTRFTEADLERVITEGLSPLYVSIHATDPEVRTRMLRNRRGATSLRWLEALLDAGIKVHGQVVVCPGVNDGAVLEQTLAGILDRFPRLADVACVPLGVSRHSNEPGLRPHTPHEAAAVIDLVAEWQAIFRETLGRRMVFLSDEYHLIAGRPFPGPDEYEDFSQHENGVGMAAAFALEWHGLVDEPVGPREGFFQAVDLPPSPAPYASAPRRAGSISLSPRRGAPVCVVTGTYGADVLRPFVGDLARILAVRNDFFGGNTAVAGLLVGEDLQRALADQPMGHRYLLPDVCLNDGRFLDGLTPADLPRPVEIVPADGLSLRRALDGAPASLHLVET